ncbi:MAG: murein biosynthesis integral membrane protein MurJ [Armatimonadota bacterium]
MKSKLTTVAAGAAIIFAGTLLSRILGLVRDNLLMNTFSERWMTDAYLSAFLVPDTVYYLLAGGALSSAFIPVFSSYLTKEKRDDANRVASSIMNLMLLAICAGLIIIFIFAPSVIRVLAHGYEPGTPKFNLTVILAREMCVMVIFTALSGLMTGMLNSYRHFLMPVVVWNTYNLGILFGITVLSKIPVPANLPGFLHWEGQTLGIHGAAFGIVLGAITLAAFQLPVVIKHGFRYSPIIDWGHEGVRKVLILFLPVMVGLALQQVNLLMVPQVIGSALPDGAVTDLRNANRLILLPLGLFAIAVSTAAFPKLAEQVAQGATQAFRDTIARGVKVILLFAFPSTVGMLILTEPINALLWGGKGYGITDIRAAAFALAFFCLGLVALSMSQLINRAFYSLHDTLTPVIVGVLMVAANIGLALYLIKFSSLSYGGVALSTSITTILSTLILFEILRRKLGGIGGHAIAVTTGKLLLASTMMGVVIYFVASWLAPTSVVGGAAVWVGPHFPFPWPAPDLAARISDGMGVSRHDLALQIGASGLAGMMVYLLAIWLLRVEELHVISSRLLGKLRRKAPTTV